jgi:hypothetical protein
MGSAATLKDLISQKRTLMKIVKRSPWKASRQLSLKPCRLFATPSLAQSTPARRLSWRSTDCGPSPGRSAKYTRPKKISVGRSRHTTTVSPTTNPPSTWGAAPDTPQKEEDTIAPRAFNSPPNTHGSSVPERGRIRIHQSIKCKHHEHAPSIKLDNKTGHLICRVTTLLAEPSCCDECDEFVGYDPRKHRCWITV